MPIDPINFGITDEVIAIRATADYFTFAPKDQVLCEGEDGTFAAGERWTLRSATADLSASGCVPGSMIQVEFPEKGMGNGQPGKTRYIPAQFAINSVDDTEPDGLILRRKGEATTGIGQPPAPIGGAAKCRFRSLTCQPQVRVAAAKVTNKYKSVPVPDTVSDNDFADLVYWRVVRDLYYAQARMAGDPKDDFWQKYKEAKAEAAMIESEINDRYNVTPDTFGLTLSILPGRSAIGRRERREGRCF